MLDIDSDRPAAFAEAADFAISHRFYLAAFNHLTPFPGTPLYKRLEAEGRLVYDRWWLDERYGYNDLPFRPLATSPEAVRQGCISARRAFYGWRSMARRALDSVNRADGFMLRNFLLINGMHRAEIAQRDRFPLGDPAWRGPLLEVA